MTNYGYKASLLYDKYLGKDYYYLILMTIYHIEILLMVTFLGIEFQTHTFLPMITSSHANELSILNYQLSFTSFNAVFFTLIILIIDFIFLFIIKKEIKSYENRSFKKFFFNLTNKKILIIEVFILFISIGNPLLRASLYFFSLNTIQIYVIYRVLFRLKIFNPVIILGVYIAIIQLFLSPFWVLFKLFINNGV